MNFMFQKRLISVWLHTVCADRLRNVTQQFGLQTKQLTNVYAAFVCERFCGKP